MASRHAQQQRILARLQYDKTTGCLLWTGARDNDGYGRAHYGGQQRRIHQITWSWFNDPLPPGRELDHTCSTRHCGAPWHLEAVTHRENIARGVRRRTTCRRGHRYTDKSTYRRPDGRRNCRTCKKRGNVTSSVRLTETQAAILDILSGAKHGLTIAQVRRVLLGAELPADPPPEYIAAVIQPEQEAQEFWDGFHALLPLGLIFPDSQSGALFTYVATLAGRNALASHARRGFQEAESA